MAGATSVLTFIAGHANGGVETLTSFPLPERFANACISYTIYLWKAFWPFRLGVLYPLKPPDPGAALLAGLFLLAITAIALGTTGKHPYLAVGWLWYLGTLVPVSGVVQAGVQSHADRFTYLPLVGCSIALVWAIADVAANNPILRQGAGILAGAMLLLLAVGAHAQAAYWRDSVTLFQHTLDVTQRNYIILNSLGVRLALNGRHDEAMADYQQAISINPGYAEAHANVGHELLLAGKVEEAYGPLVEALRLKPDLAIPQDDLGVVLMEHGNFEEARPHVEESVRLAPANAELQSNLCLDLQRLGRLDEALAHCDEALRLKPDFVNGHFNRGTALAAEGKNAAAEAELERVLAADPNHADARATLERLRTAHH